MNETNYLEVKGMHCPHCAGKIENAVSRIQGVLEIQVNEKTEKGRVTFNRKQTTLADVLHAIEEAGFEAEKLDL
ncbi:cation transporter [Virgibacillus xinjiangensis]|uniref:Copper chaperone CopZ n=1 Tax=Virgibacillus xinjiangensis TaxID=393090 RepID=A0ABV7CQK1_9BACI